MVSENSEIKLKSNKTEALDESARVGLPDWNIFQSPIAGCNEQVFIHDLKEDSEGNVKIEIENKEIGFISQINDKIYVLGLKSELRFVNLQNLKIQTSISIEPDKLNNRINDGKVDPIGRLWFGTMDNLEKKQTGSLYCLDNYLKLHKVDQDYFITNGPAFLSKNSFYHTDSKKRVIYKININNKFQEIWNECKME